MLFLSHISLLDDKFNKLTSVFHASVLLSTMILVIIVKVAVDPRGDRRVDPQTTLTML